MQLAAKITIGALAVCLVILAWNSREPVEQVDSTRAVLEQHPDESAAFVDDADIPFEKPQPRILLPAPHDALFVDIPDNELDHAAIDALIASAEGAIGRYRIVRINSDTIRARIRQVENDPSFDIQLIYDEPITLTATKAVEYHEGLYTGIARWSGYREGDVNSSASFQVAPDGTVRGDVQTLETGRIAITPIKNTPHHMIWQWAENYSKEMD